MWSSESLQSLDKANTTRLPRLKREFKVEHSDALAHLQRGRHASVCRPPKHCQQSARPKPSPTRTLGCVFGPAAAGLRLTVWGKNTLHLKPPILCHSMANPGLSVDQVDQIWTMRAQNYCWVCWRKAGVVKIWSQLGTHGVYSGQSQRRHMIRVFCSV